MDDKRMVANVVELKEITKEFNHVQVLDRVDFELRQGEIHALLGENGAGKSTLMKILCGVYQPDGGDIRIQGQKAHFQSSHDSMAKGIAMVFQEFSLVPSLTVAQNIFLSRETRSWLGLLNDRRDEKRAQKLLQEIGVEIDPHLPVSELSVGFRQLTEIAAALSKQAQILVLDEPTASLTHKETQALFKLIRGLKTRGVSTIYISHRMEEIFQIADRITVLRDGKKIITEEIKNLNVQAVIKYILGRKAARQASYRKAPTIQKKPLLEVNNLRCNSLVSNISFKLYPGEVLGIVGLMGSGRTELVQAIFGMNSIQAGEIFVNGKPLKVDSPERSMQSQIALIPEDRRLQGLVMGHSIRDNFMLPLVNLKHLRKNGVLVNDRKGDALADRVLKQMRVRYESIHKEVRLLSGGNQQKVVIAKWLSTEPKILLMDEPTAGVDIGTKTEILEMVRELAKAGKGIIFISSELHELLSISDRLLILRKAKMAQEISRADVSSEKALHSILQGAQ